MHYILGETDENISAVGLEEYKHLTLSLADQARQSIDIFTQDLEPKIYNNKSIEQSILTLSKKHPNTRIRILVHDSRESVQNGHRLVKLAQQLTSSIFIHNPSKKYKNESNAFIVVDNIGYIQRTLVGSRTYKANANFSSPAVAAKMTDKFNTIWEQSVPDIQTRRVYI